MPESSRRNAVTLEKLVDFGYRAMHEMAVQSKALIQAFYRRAPQLSNSITLARQCPPNDRRSAAAFASCNRRRRLQRLVSGPRDVIARHRIRNFRPCEVKSWMSPMG